MKINCSYSKLIPTSQIMPNPKNTNEHPEKQVRLLAKIIDYQGWRHPIVVSNLSGLVVAGHGRLEAAKMNGYEEAPVDYQDFENAAQEMAFLEADNLVADLAKHDTNAMIDNIRELNLDEDFDLEMFGVLDFEIPEIKVLDEESEDEVPTDVETRCKLGDVWILGEHRLVCGDSTSIDAVEKLMDGDKADLLTDPPYGINANKQTLGSGEKDFHRGESWDESVPDFFQMIEFFDKYILWGGNYYCDKLPITNDWLCWDKKNPNLSFSEFELAYTNVGKNCRILSHHWSGEKKLHPTMKPVAVMEWCLDYLGKNICDLFGGSGSTLIACEKTNRKCFMMELDPHYCDVILSRWEKYTGKEATLNG